MTSIEEMNQFLEKDLYNALKELFVGAVTWQAHPEAQDYKHLRLLGMSTSFLQARALYEFFYSRPESSPSDGGNASVHHFVDSWAKDKTCLYENFMAGGKAVQKRVFHLVYGRSEKHGGVSDDELTHLKNQVCAFAVDLLGLTREFVQNVKPEFRDSAQLALNQSLQEAQSLADTYEIPNPFT